MSWLMMHAAFGQIAQKASANPRGDQSAGAAAQMGAVADALGGAKADEAIAAWFDKFWVRVTKERALDLRAQLFIDFAVPGSSRLWLLNKALTDTNANAGAVKRMYGLFLENASAGLVAEFVADPDKGLTEWQSVMRRRYAYLGKDPVTQRFRQEVERGLIEAYVQRATVALRKDMVGISQATLNANMDDMRHLVRDYSQKFLLVSVGAVTAWEVPLVPPERWPTLLSTGSELSGFVSGILLLPLAAAPPVGVIVVTAAVLLAAEKAGTLYVAWSDLKDKEEQYRQATVSRSVKEQLRTAYEQVSHLIESQQDLFAMIFAVGAMKAGLDFETGAQDPLRSYVWQQLFKDLPQDPTAARHKLMQELEAAFKRAVLGS